ncbi:hypothetical protein [Fibrobacter sp.]|uniref:hypothetical protein n=1 Tax=Fibrobacter sp. TaxID=35828 RepID=UPI00386A6FD9
MNLLLAIPARGQNKYLAEMKAAIHAMSVKPCHVLYMADRPTVKEIVEARTIIGHDPLIEYYPICQKPDYVGRPTMTHGVDWFLTGHVRNCAVDYIIKHGDIDAVVFIDGDCIPEPDLIKSHMAVLDSKEPKVSVGKRKEVMYNWQDQRDTAESSCNIFHDVPTEVLYEAMFVDSGVVWTCNFGMNVAALGYLRQLNATLYGREETFSSEFLGTWGGEDGFIGLECYYTGVPVIALENGNNGIRHKYHLRNEDKYNHTAFIQFLEDHREQLLYLLDLYNMNVRNCGYIPREELIELGYDVDQHKLG